MTEYDAILVPGGGLTGRGEPHPWVVERLNLAAERRGNASILCLSGFTPHKPPPADAHGFPVAEATAGTRHLLSRGVPADKLLNETASFDTIGNAYFSRVIHADVLGWTNLLVITSTFHMPRTRAIFETLYALPAEKGGASRYRLEFAETADVGMTPDDLAARVAKEARDLERWRANVARLDFRSLRDVHRWLFTEHDCYAAGRRPVRAEGAALMTY